MSHLPAKLLVTPFRQGVIPGTRLKTTKVLSHPMKHPCSPRPRIPNGFVLSARELRATERSKKSDVVGTILLFNSLH